jgi:hypothetical protein
MRALTACLMASLILTTLAHADTSAGLPAAYLRTGWGPRAGALGNALVAGAQGPDALYWDPAALASQGRPALASSYDWMSLQRQFNSAGLVIPWQFSDAVDANDASPGQAGKNPVGVFSLGWTDFSLGNDFEGRTTDTASFYTFGDRQDAYSLGFGRNMLDWWQLGAAFKVYQHDLDVYHANGWGMDLGTRLLIDPRLTFAADAQDLGASLTWNTGTRENIPWTLRVGFWGVLWPSVWDLGLQAQEVESGGVDGSIGSEFHILKIVDLRLGWMSQGLTFGAGLKVQVSKLSLHVDYAYLPDALDLGADQRVGVRIDF